METLAFYSYKGGAGRSRLLSDAARFLSSRGRGVMALDLDLEAPGLHYRLEPEAAHDRGLVLPGGVVPYLVEMASGTASPPRLKEHFVEIPVHPGAGGWLRLMPAGPAPERAYWAALQQLGSEIRFDDPSGKGLMLLLDLHARIEAELQPDYLLMDIRAGVTELGGLATMLLADTVVCLFSSNRESLDGTARVFEGLRTAPRLESQSPIRIVPILQDMPGQPAAGLERLRDLVETEPLRLPQDGGTAEILLKMFPELG